MPIYQNEAFVESKLVFGLNYSIGLLIDLIHNCLMLGFPNSSMLHTKILTVY